MLRLARLGSTRYRLPFLFLPLLFVATKVVSAAPTSSGVVVAPSPQQSLSASGLDLMEVAYRAGVELFEAGDYGAAVRTWLAPAEHGHPNAQFSLGVAYATGKGVAVDMKRAVEWWMPAATHGHVGAQLNLGLLYWRGEGVEKDLAKARFWWQRAATGGDAAAQFHLGAQSATGEGAPRDYKEAVRWWRMSADQGYRQAIEGLEILKTHGAAED